MTLMPAPGTVPEWTVGDRLRKARETAGLTQQELAAEIGVSHRSITNYESDRSSPKRPVLVTWAMRTGVDLSWILQQDAPSPDGGKRPRQDSNLRPADYTTNASSPSRPTDLAERRLNARSTRPSRNPLRRNPFRQPAAA